MKMPLKQTGACGSRHGVRKAPSHVLIFLAYGKFQLSFLSLASKELCNTLVNWHDLRPDLKANLARLGAAKRAWQGEVVAINARPGLPAASRGGREGRFILLGPAVLVSRERGDWKPISEVHFQLDHPESLYDFWVCFSCRYCGLIGYRFSLFSCFLLFQLFKFSIRLSVTILQVFIVFTFKCLLKKIHLFLYTWA